MQKIYSLLRNNKQSGPFTLDEFMALGLRPDDLIWAEGKTAGWCYPNEIEELKSLLSNVSEVQQEVEYSKNKQALTDSSTESTCTANHIYISLPSGFTKTKSEKGPSPEVVVTSTPDNELAESPEAKLERKAKELKQRIQAFSEQKALPKGDNELDVKYARSLDDIKSEYSSWLQDQKKKKVNPFQPLVFFSIGVSILILGFLGVCSFVNKESSNSFSPTAIAKKDTLESNAEYIADNASSKAEVAVKSVEQDHVPKEMIHAAKAATSNHPDNVDNYIDSLRRPERRIEQTSVVNPEDSEPSPSSNKEVSMPSNPINPKSTPSTSEMGEQSNHTKKNADKAVPLDQLIQLSQRSLGEERELLLHNNSSQALKFVAVDIYYYKTNKNLLQKKTLYFQNINPETSVSLPIPEYKKAATIQYHVGLISSEKSLYYAKQ